MKKFYFAVIFLSLSFQHLTVSSETKSEYTHLSQSQKENIYKQIESRLGEAKSMLDSLSSSFDKLDDYINNDSSDIDESIKKELKFAKVNFKKDFDRVLSPGGPYIFAIMKIYKDLYIWIHIYDPPKLMVLNPKKPLYMGSILSRIATPDSSLPIVFVFGDYHESLSILPKINCPIALIGVGASITQQSQPAIKIEKNMKISEKFNTRTAYIVGFNLYNNIALNGPALYVDNSKVIAALNYIHDNQASVMGGGVYIKNDIGFPFLLGERPMLLGNLITNNQAPKGGGIACENDGGSITVANIITNNTATDFGGGLFITESGSIAVGNVITHNDADLGGGGVAIRKASKPIVSLNYIAKNDSKQNGGGIWVTRGGGLRLPAVLCFNYILDNTAVNDGGGIALDNDGDAVIILNGSISGNKAQRGGGISLYHPNKDLTYLMGNKIHNNDAVIGGGIWAESFDGNISTFNIIHNNVATSLGGGLYLLNCDLYLGNNYIDDNTAQLGGGVYQTGSGFPRYFDNHSISSNHADIGAGIYLYDMREINIEGNQITENVATDKGGGLYMNKVTTPYIFSNKFLSNTARFGGGTFYEFYTEVDMHDNIYQKNMAKNGGGVYVNYHRGDIFKNVFKANETSGNGAAIYVPAGMTPNIYNNTFLGNIAGSNKAPSKIPDNILAERPIGIGGAIYSTGLDANPSITGNLFKWNHAYSGGAVAIVDSSRPILKNNDFIENAAGELYDIAQGIGGGLLISNTEVTIDSSNFIANYATNGGGVAVVSQAEAIFINDDFRWNVADIDSVGIGKGGAIFGSDSLTEIFIGNPDSPCNFKENFSSFGGAVAGENSSTFNIQSSFFDANRAAYNTNGSGGAAHFEGKNTNADIGGNAVDSLFNSFFRNTAGTLFFPVKGNGGILSAVNSAQIRMQGNYMLDHNASNNLGGAVYLYGLGTKAEIGGGNDSPIIQQPLETMQLGNVIQNNNRRRNAYPKFWYETVSIPLDKLDSADCELEEEPEMLDTATTTITEQYDSSPTIAITPYNFYFPRSYIGVVNLSAGVQFYDITNPLVPQLSAVLSSPDITYNIEFKDSTLLIADGINGIQMYKTTPLLNNQPPQFLDDIIFSGISFLDVAIINNYIYALGSDDKIYIIQKSGNNLLYSNTYSFGDPDTIEVGSIEAYNNVLFADVRSLNTSTTGFTALNPSGNNLTRLDTYVFNGIITDFAFTGNSAYITYSVQIDDTTFNYRLQGLTIANLWDFQQIATPNISQAREFTTINITGNFCNIGHNDGYMRVDLISGTWQDRIWTVPSLDIETYDGIDYAAHGYAGMASYNSGSGTPIFESERPQEKENFQVQWMQGMNWPPDTSWYWEPPEPPDTVICNSSNIIRLKEMIPSFQKMKSLETIQSPVNPDSLPRGRYVYDNDDIIITKKGGFLAITNNASADVYGNLIGGIYEFDGNQATEYGGGIYIERGGNDINIGGNYNDENNNYINYLLGNQSAKGGAIALSNSLSYPVKIVNNIIGGTTDLQSNLAHLTGGGIHSDTANLFVQYNIIQNNIAGIDSIPNKSPGGFGAGIALFESRANIKNNWLIGNYSLGNAAGIGIAKYSGKIYIQYNTFSENIAVKSRIPFVEDTLGLGTDIFIGTLSDSLIINHNLFDHFGLLEAYSIYADSSKFNDTIYYLDKSKINISDNDIWNNTGLKYGGQLTDLTGTNGNISQNPLFVSPKEFNFSLDPSSPAVSMGWNPNPDETKISSNIYVVPGTHSTISDALDDANFGDKIIVKPGYDGKNETYPLYLKDGVILTGSAFNIPYNLNLIPNTILNGKDDTVFVLNNTGPRTVLSGFTVDNNDLPVVFISSPNGLVYGNIIKGKNKSVEMTFIEDTNNGNDHFYDRLILDHNTILNKVNINYDTLNPKKLKYDWLGLQKLQFGPVFSYNIASIEANIVSPDPGNVHHYLDEPPIFITFEMNDFWKEDLKGYYDGINDVAINNLRTNDPIFVDAQDYHLLQGSHCIIADSVIVLKTDDTLHRYYDYTAMIGTLYANIKPFFRADTLQGPPGLEITLKDSSKAELRHEIKEYTWKWGNGDENNYMAKTYNEPSYHKYIYNDAGTYTVSLSIRDRYQTFTYLKPDYINADTSWKLAEESFTKNLNAVFFTDSLDGWIVGDEGTVLNTTDGGDTWTEQTTGNKFKKDDNIKILSGNWKRTHIFLYEHNKDYIPSVQAIEEDLNDIYFSDKVNGWISGDNGIILHTTDAGKNWNNQESKTTNALNKIQFIDNLNGFAVGNNGTVLYTSDGGSSWNSQNSNTQENFYGLYFDKSNSAWAAGTNGKVIFKDGTNDWLSQLSSTNLQLNAIDFASLNNGWICGSEGTLLNTTNLGSSWLTKDITARYNLNSVDFINSSRGWIVGDKGTILFTTNSGNTWTSQYSGTSNDLSDVFFINEFNGWAVGKSGGILFTVNGGKTVSNVASSLYSHYISAYPNPFDGVLVINYIVPNDGNVEINIYNTFGTEVKNILREFKAAGDYQYRWLSDDDSVIKLVNGLYIIEYKISSRKEIQRHIISTIHQN